MDTQATVWARRLLALAQTGLTYAQNIYDIERYQQLREMACDMLAAGPAAASGPGAPAGAAAPPALDEQALARAARLEAFMAGQEGYATPKVDVRAVIFRDGPRGPEVLLVREAADGLWTLPGGWADVGVSPRENAEREVREEAGFEVRADKLLAIYDRSRHIDDPACPFHVYKLFFRCEVIGGAAATSHETLAVEFFARGAVPELSATRVTSAMLARMFEHYDNPGLPTDFE